MKRLSTAIIYAHPYDKSFNHAILDSLTSAMGAENVPCEVIDLYRDGFNPVYQPEELALFSQGKYLDPLVEKYQNILRRAERVIFIFPIWWGEAPAVVKGFFDKVMLPGFGYVIRDGRMAPGLDMQQTLVISTSEAPTDVFRPYFEGYFIPMSLTTIGFNNASWHNCPGMSSDPDSTRTAFIEHLLTLL